MSSTFINKYLLHFSAASTTLFNEIHCSRKGVSVWMYEGKYRNRNIAQWHHIVVCNKVEVFVHFHTSIFVLTIYFGKLADCLFLTICFGKPADWGWSDDWFRSVANFLMRPITFYCDALSFVAPMNKYFLIDQFQRIQKIVTLHVNNAHRHALISKISLVSTRIIPFIICVKKQEYVHLLDVILTCQFYGYKKSENFIGHRR